MPVPTDWSHLEHAYGCADDVPEMLAALTDPDPERRASARTGLHASLAHQGVHQFEATVHAIPAIVAAVAAPATPDRGPLLRLLAELAVGDTCWFLHDGFHPDLQCEVDNAARAQHVSVIRGRDFASRGFPRLAGNRLDAGPGTLGRAIVDAVAAGLPTYLAAARDPDPAVRAAVPFVCAFLTLEPAATASVPVLVELLDDPAALVRASAALGLSHAAKFVPALRARALTTLLARWPRLTEPLERRAVALALVRFEEPDLTDLARAHLAGELTAGLPAVSPGPDWPWFRIDSPPFVFCTTFIGTAAGDRDALRAPACAALAHVGHDHDAADLALWIARIWTPRVDASAPLEADDDVRATLAALAAAPAAWAFSDLGSELRGRGLPADRDELRAWLQAS